MSIPQNILEWLKEPSNPSIRYRTLLELEDYSFTNSEVQNAYTEVLNWKPVLAIQKAMNPDGYWTVKVEKGKIVGDTTEYRTFNTTHWVLGYIAEYGLTRREEFIEQAANRYLNLQHEDGDFFQHLSCLYGPTNKYLKPGPLGESNKWITFYAYLLKKMRNMENYNVFNNVSSYY